ncbi:MAG: hypothetical protein AUJ82_08275 [Verrucomicrobia bacterium CG1_02_43_26]|nr:MAG: hypothetical protein AUJ82_08275 [Verrucomicrobia bacterium CG1_02_43_26]
MRLTFRFFLFFISAITIAFATEQLSDQAEPVNESDLEKELTEPGTYPSGIAAIVDDQIITLQDVRLELEGILPQIQRESLTEAEFNQRVDAIGREILENLIDRELIVEDFNRKKMKIPQAYLDNQFADFLSKNFNGDRTQLLEYLSAHGKTLREFKDEMRKNVIVSVMRDQKMKSQSEVSPEKILTYYQEHPQEFVQKEGVKLRQITLVPYTNESQEVLLQQADKILQDLRAGMSFQAAAKKYSQDHMKETGGDWGWINRTDIRTELADVAFALEKNTYSEPVSLDNYVFILYVEDKREDGIMPLEEVRDEIERKLANNLAQQAHKKWIQRLREKAHIRYYI